MQSDNEKHGSPPENDLEDMMHCFTKWVDEDKRACCSQTNDEKETSLFQPNDDIESRRVFSNASNNMFSQLNTADRNEESASTSDVARRTSSDMQDGSNNDEESVATETGSAMSEDLDDVASNVQIEDLAASEGSNSTVAASEGAEGNNNYQGRLNSVGDDKNSESDSE